VARTSYFQKVLTRAVDAPPLQPASGLLTRWTQVADAWPTMDRKAPPSPPTAVAARPLTDVAQTTAPPGQPRREPIAENEAQSPGIQPTVQEPHRVAQPIRPRRDETLQPPPEFQERARESRTNQAIEPKAATPMPVARSDPGRTPITQTERRAPPEPAHLAQRVTPAPLPSQERPTPRGEAATRVVKERVERQIMMPAPPQSTAFPPPPIPKREATVEIGTIEVKIIREPAPVPAVAALQQQTGPPRASSQPAAQAAPISRGMAVAHGFHQS
jgi:hypothetical protein